MQRLHLPPIPGCVVSDPGVSHGLKLEFHVDPESGIVHVRFDAPAGQGSFAALSRTGCLSLVLDRAMNYAATWTLRRLCLGQEILLRVTRPLVDRQPLLIEARVEFSRPMLIQTVATVRNSTGGIVAVAEAKYVPLSQDLSDQMMQSLVGLTPAHH